MRSTILLAALLTGCASTPPVVQEVKIPVFTSCVKSVPARPAFGAGTVPPTASDGEKVLAIARDIPLHLKYEGALEAVIEGCR